MFSFLRKSKPVEPAPASSPVPVVAPPESRLADSPVTPSPTHEEVVVFNNNSAEAVSAVEEAAVYFANNMADQALATLIQYLQDFPEKKELQPWLMLFDLYQAQNNKPAFDELSMQFAVGFERSAPIWKMPAAPMAPRKADPAQKDLLTMGSQLVASPQLERLCQMAQGSGSVKVDLHDVASVAPGGCKLMQEGLSSCRKKGRLVQLEGVEHLIEVVKTEIASHGHGGEDSLAWLLLFELYQWLGKEAEYEDLAVEYAVNFEISPPAWEALKPALLAARTPSPAAPRHVPEGDSFALRGVISEASQTQLQEISNYAADRQEVRINMAEVTRVDFVAVGNFMSVLINLTQADKKVLILEANEMIQALFHMMGVSEFATLIRRKSC